MCLGAVACAASKLCCRLRWRLDQLKGPRSSVHCRLAIGNDWLQSHRACGTWGDNISPSSQTIHVSLHRQQQVAAVRALESCAPKARLMPLLPLLCHSVEAFPSQGPQARV